MKRQREQLYDYDDMSDAYYLLEERVVEILNKVSEKDIKALAYAIAPDTTAVGWPKQSLIEAIVEHLRGNFDILKLTYDGNGGYSLMRVAEKIENNEL